MNVKRFTARKSRDALKQVRQVFGQDAIVLSTRPCPEGVEVLAMAPESVQQFERVAVAAPRPSAAPAGDAPWAAPGRPAAEAGAPSRLAARAAAQDEALGRASSALRERLEPSFDGPSPSSSSSRQSRELGDEVNDDVQQLSMSTLSFQDYVRERMLRRRKAELEAQAASAAKAAAPAATAPSAARPMSELRSSPQQEGRQDRASAAGSSKARPSPASGSASAAAPLVMPAAAADPLAAAALARERAEMVNELRSMKGLIEERFGTLAFMEKLQRQPRQALLSQKLLDSGFSPALTRKLVASLPAEGDEAAWAASVLQRNLQTAEREAALEDQGGVWALVGSTGVGKTTSTAKLAAAFASKHGAANLGLITLDAYRMGAQEQLRAYGRILGVPVHTAHDRASLDDLLDLLSGKKMVLIDTAGIAQRDARTAELMEMLSHPSIQRMLVVNASAQGETIEDVVNAYRTAACKGVVLTKVDEAVKLGPALDAMIRHRLKVVAVANGQRVPEDWHRLSSATLVQRALRAAGSSAWRMDSSDVNLVFAGSQAVEAPTRVF
jgi:flagellar biosynthesis protein FlhF